MKNYTHFLYYCSFLLFLTSCGIGKSIPAKKLAATVYYKNQQKISGQSYLPSHDTKVMTLDTENNPMVIDCQSIDKIEYVVNNKTTTFCYKPLSESNYGWVVLLADGPFVSAYVGSGTYSINSNGNLELIGTTQTIVTGQHGERAIIQPSFPVYMMKKSDTKLSMIGVKHGVNFEAAGLRVGITHYLFDDKKLVDYVREAKMGFSDLKTIVDNYQPNRGNGNLVIDGKQIVIKKTMISNAFDHELMFYSEAAFPSNKYYKSQFALGIRTSTLKFITYGGDVGYASTMYLDDGKYLSNHIPWNATATDADLSKTSLFRANIFAGLQLPLRFNNFYLLPSIQCSLGALLSDVYGTINYSPSGTFEIGHQFEHGNILLLGVGYRRTIALIGEETKAEASKPGFEGYQPFNSLFFRLSYKF